MFSLMLLEFHASLHIKNRQSLTPLTLAAKLARKEVIKRKILSSFFVYNNFILFKDVRFYTRSLETCLVCLC